MGRRPREGPPEGWHHVYSRGIRKSAIFADNSDRARYLDFLGAAFEKRQVKLFAYCLLGNHYHLGVYDPVGELSEAMHELGTNYARHFNDRNAFDGPLFRSRFGSRLLQNDRDLVSVSRYIHRNSLDVDPHASIADYRWSSFAAYIGRKAGLGCLATDTVLQLAGGRSAYRSLVEDETAATYDAGSHRTVSISVDDIECEIKRVFGIDRLSPDPDEQEGTMNARACAATLAIELRQLRHAEAARRYGYSDPRALVRAISRYQMRLRRDLGLGGVHEQIRTNLVILGRSRAS